jgi:fibronectin-binding autotransporter adhesin
MKPALLLVATGFIAFAVQAQVAPTEANLRAAAAAGGETKFSASGTITLTSPVAFNLPTTLDANGHTVIIDGQTQTRLLEVNSGAELTLKGLALVNGWHRGTNSSVAGGAAAGPAHGGAIYNTGGSVTAISCVFSNNLAIGGSGNVSGSPLWAINDGGPGLGGAIFQSFGSLVISNSLFSKNGSYAGYGKTSTSSYGGAICALAGFIKIDQTDFTTNTAAGSINGFVGGGETRGGALYIDAQSLTLQRSRFFGNVADGFNNAPAYGGAIFTASGTNRIEFTFFSGNTAKGGPGRGPTGSSGNSGAPAFGGALHVATNAFTLVDTSAFISNTAIGGQRPFNFVYAYGTAYGGAVAVHGTTRIINSTFAANAAYTVAVQDGSFSLPPNGRGGAVYNANVTSFNHVTVANNNSLDPILVSASGTFSLTNSLFARDSGTTAGSGLIDGGNNLSATATPAFARSTSANNLNLKLGPLGDYGGPTPTIVLLAGSPAIDAAIETNVSIDQRGHARPFGAGFDVGAFESSPPFYVFGKLHGYRNDTTTVTFGGSTVTAAADGSFTFVVPAGENSFTFAGTNSVFRANPLVASVTADGPLHTRAFELNALVFDPDLASPSFTLAAKAGEIWEIYLSNDLVNWTVADTHTFATDGVVSVSIPNTGEPTFVKAIRK